MKTNYMNSKQKLFAITLTIVTVISLAWIKPLKAEVALNNNSLSYPAAKSLINEKITNKLNAVFSMQQESADTSKKKRNKKLIIKTGNRIDTVCTVAPGSSIDSTIKITINKTIQEVRKIHVNLDSVSNLNAIHINGLNSISLDTQDIVASVIHQSNGAMVNKYGMPVYGIGTQNTQPLTAKQKEKMLALQKEMAAITKKMQKELSTIQKVKMEKMAKNMKGNLYSVQQQANLQRLGQELATKNIDITTIVSSPDFKYKIQELKNNHNMPTWIYTTSPDDQTINSSPEYQALKNKFDADVKALKDKKAAQEKAKDGVLLNKEK